MYKKLKSVFIIDYVPQVNDCVIGVIKESFAEEYSIDINSSFDGRLNHLAFEGATKRNRPRLKVFTIRKQLRVHGIAWMSSVLSRFTSNSWSKSRAIVSCR